jgi:hypothetical protein
MHFEDMVYAVDGPRGGRGERHGLSPFDNEEVDRP